MPGQNTKLTQEQQDGIDDAWDQLLESLEKLNFNAPQATFALDRLASRIRNFDAADIIDNEDE